MGQQEPMSITEHTIRLRRRTHVSSIAARVDGTHIREVFRKIRVASAALLLLLIAPATAQTQAIDSVNKPGAFAFIRNFPGDVEDYSRLTFRKRNAVKIGEMVVATTALVVADQHLTDDAYRLGDKLDLSHSSHQKTYAHLSLSVDGKRLALPISAPDNIGTAMYFIGDGITHFSIAGSFLAYGLLKNDNRAERTASELTEAIITTGFVTQLLKHITGRERPFVSTEPGGEWRVFPNQADYARHAPHYDAFPSGHMATAMATLTVISSDYPEDRFIKPVGYSLMSLLGFEMLNNKVHWASDYPLAIALGKSFAKIAVKKGRTETKPANNSEPVQQKADAPNSFEVSPYLSAAGPGLAMAVRF